MAGPSPRLDNTAMKKRSSGGEMLTTLRPIWLALEHIYVMYLTPAELTFFYLDEPSC